MLHLIIATESFKLSSRHFISQESSLVAAFCGESSKGEAVAEIDKNLIQFAFRSMWLVSKRINYFLKIIYINSWILQQGLIPSRSSDPSWCWFKWTSNRARKPKANPEYSLKLGPRTLGLQCESPDTIFSRCGCYCNNVLPTKTAEAASINSTFIVGLVSWNGVTLKEVVLLL